MKKKTFKGKIERKFSAYRDRIVNYRVDGKLVLHGCFDVEQQRWFYCDVSEKMYDNMPFVENLKISENEISFYSRS